MRNFQNINSVKILKILTTPSFERAIKKLHQNAKVELDSAVKTIAENPLIGIQKKGDLDYAFVYKFCIVNQLTLLAYTYNEANQTITLLAIGPHENFYRDLKK